MNDVTVRNPFGLEATQQSTGGAVQARESSEVMAAVASAKRFPRDVVRATDGVLMAFTRPTLCERAQYAFSRGGSDVSGPSIHAAQAIQQKWGNMSSGWREISRRVGADGVGESEVEAYSVDYESNNRESITFFVRHWRDTKRGGYALKDERDIYELCANMAQRRKRACILAQLPGDVVEAAMQQATVTLNATADTSPDGLRKLEEAFAAIGVTREVIEKKIGRRITAILPAQIVTLKRIYTSLRDGMSEPAEWFDMPPEAAASTGLDAVREAAAKKRESKSTGADPATGEVPPPPPATSAKPAAPAPAPEKRTYAQFADLLKMVNDPELAALEMDAARDDLPPDQFEELCTVYRAKFQQAK